MKVVVAPDKFAGTLSASAAANAIAAGWRTARPGDELCLVPLADGGDGTVDVVEAALAAARRMTAEVADARGRAVWTAWLLLPDGRALVEAAAACGLARLEAGQRDPRLTTTYGVGQLIAAAAAAGAREIVVGVGGTATVDGGAGMATALGHRLLRADGNGVKVGGQHLRELRRIVPRGALNVPVVAATDVRNPLLGSAGAVAVFAPQKGAGPEDLPVLEEALSTLADVAERDLGGGPWRARPGAGAGGGLGFGLAAFGRAPLVSGARVVADLVGLARALEGAHVVVTGEGRVDAQTTQGKVAAHVAEQARAVGAKVVAVTGSVTADAPEIFDAVEVLGDAGLADPGRRVAESARLLAEALA